MPLRDVKVTRRRAASPLERAAHEYLDAYGWAIVLCHPRSKAPAMAHGWRSGTKDHDVIRRHFRREPDANVAVACRTSGLLATDADERHGGIDAIGDLERELGDLPATPVTATANGCRHLFAHPEPSLDPDEALVVSELDTTSGSLEILDRQIALLPPSVHPCGIPYRWYRTPSEFPLAQLPDLWLTRLLSLIRTTTCSGAKPRVGACSGAKLSQLREIFQDRASVQKMAKLIGMDAPVGTAMLCPLPGHDETEPSAAIDPKSFIFRNFHRRGERHWLTLQEVYASLRYGEVKHFAPGSLPSGVWAARLAFDAGLLELDLSELPLDGLRGSARLLAEGFALHHALNQQYHPEASAVMYAIDFAAAWCGVKRSTAADALAVLRKRDVVRRVGRIQTGRGRDANLYMPGDGSQRPQEGRWTDGYTLLGKDCSKL